MIKKLRYLKYYAKVLLNNWRENKETYSQHGEDILASKILGKVNSFVEIGANDGVLFSNCYKFAKAGARGICLEPSRKAFWKLKLNHIPHPRVICLKFAISNESKDLYFEEAGYESVLSNVKTEYIEGRRKIKAISLQDLWCMHPSFKKIDLLSLDVEGHEKEVLKGSGDEPLEIKVIILESDKFDQNEILSIPCLREHKVSYMNSINMILTHKSLNFSKIDVLPEGFRCL
ncbi:FkbM family methyltransferase [Opitutales bacterium]|nr:FkbM family methyltransferase [Opitutales bacterium]